MKRRAQLAPAALTRVAALSAFLWGLCIPVMAEACPVCAQSEGGGVGRKIALGLFILLPFLVVGTILFILRTALRREEETTVLRSEA